MQRVVLGSCGEGWAVLAATDEYDELWSWYEYDDGAVAPVVDDDDDDVSMVLMPP